MDKEKQKAIIFSGCAMILFYCALQNLTAIGRAFGFVFHIFYPLFLGGAIAFVMNVPMKQIEKHLFNGKKPEKYKKLRRPAAYALTLLLVIAIIVAVMLVVIPELGKTVADLISQIPVFLDEVAAFCDEMIGTYPVLQDVLSGIVVNTDEILNSIVSFLSSWTKGALSSGIGLITGVVSGISTSFVAFVFSVYLLFQKETLAKQGKKILYALCSKEKAKKTLSVLALTEKTFASFISGQCLEAVILGSMFVVTMSVLRLPYAWLMGVIIAVTALIPMVGAFIGCFIGAFLILLVSPVKAVIFVIMFLVLQQIEGNLIYPHVVGKSVGLPGLWVLLAVVVGGNLLGVAGMLLFIPLFSVFYVLFGEMINRRLQNKKITVE